MSKHLQSQPLRAATRRQPRFGTNRAEGEQIRNDGGCVTTSYNAFSDHGVSKSSIRGLRPSMVAGGTCPRLLGGLPDDLRDDIAFEESDARTERVILVDDDSSVRRATQQILEYLGFEVQAYPDGQTAFQAIAQDRRPISLLVTDYNMPGLTGYELAQLVRTQRPGVPILIASGADEDSILAEVDPSEMPPFIQKPYSLNSLATKVREILDLARTESPSLLAG